MAQQLAPHPLVLNLAAGRGGMDAVRTESLKLDADAPKPPTDDDTRRTWPERQTKHEAKRRELALKAQEAVGNFGLETDDKQFACFTGYLGGRIKRSATDAKATWNVLFTNATLDQWMLVEDSDVLYADRVTDRTAAASKRDYLWVNADARIARGATATSPAAIFLSGAFTRAGDFQTSMRGDTYSPTSGLICEAITPGGCPSHSFKP